MKKKEREKMDELVRWRAVAQEELLQLRRQLAQKESHLRELGCLLGRKQAFEEVVNMLYPLIGKWTVDGRQDHSRLEELVTLVRKLTEASTNMWNLYNEKDR